MHNEAVKATTDDFVEGVAENCSGIRFSVNCGTIDHIASQWAENQVSGDYAYSRWSELDAVDEAAHTLPLENDRVLVLHSPEPPTM